MTISEYSHVLLLTPVKDAAKYLERYFDLIEQIQWPSDKLSIGILESDSTDDTYDLLMKHRERLKRKVARFTIVKKDFNLRLPSDLPRWAPPFQLARRQVLARSRNHLLFSALDAEEWVLWLDVDVIDYPADIVQTLLSKNLDILQPHCVLKPGGETFDRNGWMDDGATTLHDYRGSSGPVRMQSVGGCMLLVRADIHRDGLVFPTFKYGVESNRIRNPHPLWGKGEIETEGFAMMAADMGYQCWGLPDCEIRHASE